MVITAISKPRQSVRSHYIPLGIATSALVEEIHRLELSFTFSLYLSRLGSEGMLEIK